MIVNHLPDILAQRGLSIRQLARLTGVTYTTIRAVYHGERRSVQLSVLEAICRALNVRPGDIYGWGADRTEAGLSADAPSAIQPSPATRVEAELRTPRRVARPGDDWSVWN